MKRSRLISMGAAAAGAAAGAWAVITYRQQKREAMARLQAGSQVAQTTCGRVEYAAVGEGPAVLVLHGGASGYDQGLILAWPEGGLQLISPSRPGYLRTPLETGRTFEEQADAFVALLDALSISRAAVVGISAGGPSALHFALRHADRCWGLVMLSAISRPLPRLPAAVRFMERVMMGSDFLPWLLLNRPLVKLFLGFKLQARTAEEREKEALLGRLTRAMFPISLRLAGLFNDAEQVGALLAYPLEKISVPTLVIHGEADWIVPFAQGESCARAIPGAEFLSIPGGSRLCFVSHLEATEPALKGFLTAHAPQE